MGIDLPGTTAPQHVLLFNRIRAILVLGFISQAQSFYMKNAYLRCFNIQGTEVRERYSFRPRTIVKVDIAQSHLELSHLVNIEDQRLWGIRIRLQNNVVLELIDYKSRTLAEAQVLLTQMRLEVANNPNRIKTTHKPIEYLNTWDVVHHYCLNDPFTTPTKILSTLKRLCNEDDAIT